MAVKDPLLLLLVFSVTSLGSRDGDSLKVACTEACRDWEDWRTRCFNTHCQAHLDRGEDWFPCWLSCWDSSRDCVARCADNFWKMYTVCSRQCLTRTGKKRWRCRHACVVNRFRDIKKLYVPPVPRTVNQPHTDFTQMYM